MLSTDGSPPPQPPIDIFRIPYPVLVLRLGPLTMSLPTAPKLDSTRPVGRRTPLLGWAYGPSNQEFLARSMLCVRDVT